MADTMQPLTAVSTDVPLRDRTCRSARATRRRSAMKPVASNAFARLATGLTLAFVMSAGIAAAACSAAADETLTASRQTSAVAAP
jgi:hypothetical protein